MNNVIQQLDDYIDVIQTTCGQHAQCFRMEIFGCISKKLNYRRRFGTEHDFCTRVRVDFIELFLMYYKSDNPFLGLLTGRLKRERTQEFNDNFKRYKTYIAVQEHVQMPFDVKAVVLSYI